ncbi:MAG TPA: D-aminoacyl-tRNA deacylase [Desulfurivibrionaceae bacterium]|nr:D-aminoacyl-tRNA deacylase [Desulfurivibrionaceae bacterium]
MRAVVQRVHKASVTVADRCTGQIEAGVVVLLGIGLGDTATDARFLAEKIINLRIFDDDKGQMNRSLAETGGAVLAVSQFTLYGDCRKGRRPSYASAAPPETARPLYELFIDEVRAKGVRVETGEFQAMMTVHLANDGPVTLLLDSRKLF